MSDAPHYSLPVTVRFGDCDPAGIVFFPRYYEMANLTVECFFEERLEASFQRLHLEDGLGVPTVAIETRFEAVSRLEDRIRFDLRVERLGRSSVTVALTCRGAGDDVRLTTRHTLVAIDKATTKSRPWPDAIARRLQSFLDTREPA